MQVDKEKQNFYIIEGSFEKIKAGIRRFRLSAEYRIWSRRYAFDYRVGQSNKTV